jgi:hypothetical protein
MATSEGIRLIGSPGCAGLSRYCEWAGGTDRKQRTIQKRGGNPRARHALLPTAHDRRNRDTIFPQKNGCMERTPGGEPGCSIIII